MKTLTKIILIFCVVMILVFEFFYTKAIFEKNKNLNSSVCFQNRCFSVELARTDAELDKGLMNRASLEKNKGMLFIFPGENIYSFWMKNTLIPLDIIWIDGSGKIVYEAQSVEPCKVANCPVISPSNPAKYVLEVNAGIVKQFKIKTGDYAKVLVSN